jgi:hypothetical protein
MYCLHGSVFEYFSITLYGTTSIRTADDWIFGQVGGKRRTAEGQYKAYTTSPF